MLSYANYISYFQQLAQSHTGIQHTEQNKHFFRSTLEEALSAIPNRTIKYPAIMLLPLQIKPYGSPDNRYEKIYGGFMVLEALRNMNDFNRIEEILVNTRNIGEDFLLKIEKDIDDCQTLPGDKTFVQFDTNEVTKKEWGPVWDVAYGWSYEFPLFATYTKQYDSSKWA